jgi:hypothetical protein
MLTILWFQISLPPGNEHALKKRDSATARAPGIAPGRPDERHDRLVGTGICGVAGWMEKPTPHFPGFSGATAQLRLCFMVDNIR